MSSLKLVYLYTAFINFLAFAVASSVLEAVSVSVEVYECLAQADHKAENLAHEQRRHWDGREFDEYIIATEGRLPYCATPEELICQWETLDEILTVLALCAVRFQLCRD